MLAAPLDKLLQKGDHLLSTFTSGVSQSVVVPHVAVVDVSTVSQQVGHNVQMAFTRRDAESRPTVVVVSIDAPAADIEGLHQKKIVLLRCVKQTELIVSHCAVWNVKDCVIVSSNTPICL